MATLEDIDKKLDDLISSIATINQRCIDRGRIINGHTRTLYGEDGTGGIVAQQGLNTQKLKNMNKKESNKKEWTKIFVRSFVGPVVAALIVAAIFTLLAMWKFSGS